MDKNQKGLSLIELIIVMSILAIMAAIASPNFYTWLQKYRANSATRQVFYDLMRARTQTISNNNDVIVSFYSSAGNYKYEIHDDTNNDGNRDTGESVKVVYLEGNIQFGANGVNDVDGNPIPANGLALGGDDILSFNSRGMASESGSIYLIPTKDLGSQNDRMRAVSVLQSTGNVESWKYTSGATPGPWESLS